MDEKQIQVLVAAVEQRYKSIESIRGHVYKTCTWILGSFLLVTGWIVEKDISLTPSRKFFLCAALLVAVTFIRAFYLRDIERGFGSQLRTAAKIEEALGLYDLGVYPEHWKKAGTPEGQGNFFETSYWLIYVGAAILITAIIFS